MIYVGQIRYGVSYCLGSSEFSVTESYSGTSENKDYMFRKFNDVISRRDLVCAKLTKCMVKEDYTTEVIDTLGIVNKQFPGFKCTFKIEKCSSKQISDVVDNSILVLKCDENGNIVDSFRR